MQNTAAEEESLKGVTISEDCFAKLQFVIMRPVFGAILGARRKQRRSEVTPTRFCPLAHGIDEHS